MLIKKVIFSIMIMMLLAGCATTGSRSGNAGETPKALDVAIALKFDDVPIPTGFKPMANESFTFQNDILRVGILKYAGRASAGQIVNFYKDQMPLYNWRFLNMVEYGKQILNFEREDQTCIIVIEPSRMTTYLTLTVAPKAGRASTYKSIKERYKDEE